AVGGLVFVVLVLRPSPFDEPRPDPVGAWYGLYLSIALSECLIASVVIATTRLGRGGSNDALAYGLGFGAMGPITAAVQVWADMLSAEPGDSSIAACVHDLSWAYLPFHLLAMAARLPLYTLISAWLWSAIRENRLWPLACALVLNSTVAAVISSEH